MEFVSLIYYQLNIASEYFLSVLYKILDSEENMADLLPVIDHNFVVFVSLSLLLIILLWFFLLRKFKNKNIKIPSLRSISYIVPGDDKPRFRKRDKIRYYATRLNRKFQNLTTQLHNIKSKDQKQKLMSIFAKKILNLKEQGPKLLKRTLPDTFLEPDIEEDDSNLPEEFQLILDSIKVFGHLEKNFLLEICKNIETIKLEGGQFLFKKGDIDENVFVVKSGKIRVFIDDGESNMTIHEVQRGGNIHSLLSVLDVITGNVQKYKTVQAVAVIPSEVLRLNAHSFVTMFKYSPESMVRIVQLIAMRLHRVTFLFLHNYLGLSSELVSKKKMALPDSNVVKLSKNIPPVTNKNIMERLSTDIELTNTHSRKSTLIKRPEEIALKKLSGVNEISEDVFEGVNFKLMEGRNRSRSHSPSGLLSHQFIGSEADSPFSFNSDHLDKDIMEGEELELGESPGTILSNQYLVNLMRNVSFPDEVHDNLPRNSVLSSLSSESSKPRLSSIGIQTSKLLTAAKEDIAKLLGLPDIEVLSHLKISLVPGGTSLIKEGEEDTDVYFVVSGVLNVMQHNVGIDPNKLTLLFTTEPGELCGIATVITTEPSYYLVRALKQTRVVVIQRDFLYSLIKNDPTILLRLGNILVRRMSPFLRQVDFALEWTSIKAGYSLYKTGDVANSVYIILNGRFRQIKIKADGDREIVNELGRGEFFGFVEVLSDQPRATTIMAIRDSELAQIPSGLLSWIKRKAPQVVTRLIQLLADKLLVSMGAQSPTSSSVIKGPLGNMGNLRTVAVVASSYDVPLESFVLELQHAMMKIGASIRLTSNIIIRRLGTKALDTVNEYRLSSWLSQQEDQHRMVFYVCDNNSNSVWTRRCIRQADCVLVVALAYKDPVLGSIEKGIESDQTKVSKILVLLYPMETDYPIAGKTSEWLNSRPWITQHYHIRCPKRMFIRRKRERLVTVYKRIFEKEVPNPHSDMSRLARYITGTTVGLVLGGGGARGCSHVGAIRAMHEAGIPIDMIGGTSIGSFIGALWAEETRVTQFTQRARSFSRDMNSYWKLIMDLTYSPVSMFSGKAMNDVLEKTFKDRQIEDLWIPFFCITTDITNSRTRIHTNGSLWRFVRASMSLSGYLPPLCHPDDGSLLLDGGYVNNLPADVMHDMGADMIFAIDVGSHDDTDLTNYGDSLSGWTLLYHKFICRNPMKVLNLTEIQSRLAFVSCVRQMEQVKSSGICEYMRPPIEHYKTLQFGSFDEIQDVGYTYTKQRITQWQTDNSLKPFARNQLVWLNSKLDLPLEMGSYPQKRSMRMSRMTAIDVKDYVIGSSSLDNKQRHFIDLAELVSRIGQEEDDLYDSENEDFVVEYLAKIKMNDTNETAEEILIRTKDSSLLANTKMSDVQTDGTFKEDHVDHQKNVNSAMKISSLSTYDSRTQGKDDEGYDEDLEDVEHAAVTASDPENFYRVLDSSRRRLHRRSSLNRLHKSVTFDRSIDSN